MEKFLTKKNIIIAACVLLALVIAIVVIVLIVGSAKREAAAESSGQTSSQTETEKQKLGDVVIPVKLKGSQKICAGQYFFEYDSEKLEFVTFENGDLFDECDVNLTDEGKLQCVITNSELEDVKAKGTLITFIFKLKGEDDGEKYTVTVGEKTNMCNSNGKLKSPKIKPEKVKAK